MTYPVPDLSSIIPSKAKTWVALVGSGLTFVVPYLTQYLTSAPPWVSAVLGVVLFIATALGVYKAPYKPEGTVLAPNTPEVAAAAGEATHQPQAWVPVEPSNGVLRHPWKNRL